MELFKIEHFQHDHPGLPFPHWEPVTQARCRILKAHIAERIGMKSDADSLAVLKRVNEMASLFSRFNCDGSPPDLLPVLENLKIKPPEFVYINWYRFDNIDKMAFLDLNRNLDSIWYPVADDIEIFDDSLDWFVCISHYGTIEALKLKT
jgi:hypothetical protein